MLRVKPMLMTDDDRLIEKHYNKYAYRQLIVIYFRVGRFHRCHH